MKIKRRRFAPQELKEVYIRIATDYNSGMLVKDIAKRYHRSRATVYYALKKAAKY
jgi:transposase